MFNLRLIWKKKLLFILYAAAGKRFPVQKPTVHCFKIIVHHRNCVHQRRSETLPQRRSNQDPCRQILLQKATLHASDRSHQIIFSGASTVLTAAKSIHLQQPPLTATDQLKPAGAQNPSQPTSIRGLQQHQPRLLSTTTKIHAATDLPSVDLRLQQHKTTSNNHPRHPSQTTTIWV